ncbi:sigma factor-like helix-turn-helix DNA-binding protein [Paenibacillus sp. OSY-SE]|uniref:sigma factor-like helix-turn-helix DNA-binding protein n=1 Tax=Paenibacillus sp. OSY-SE TaxID=1196323 RepID=UPI00030E161D|nr:sigma factor-like helix-turn-helix DNA-binding protein [Paenibacillus sp. OSY-SE]
MGIAEQPLTDEMLDLNALIQLKYIQGYTLEEIAEMTELPVGTVKTKIYSTIKLFKQQMYAEPKEARV